VHTFLPGYCVESCDRTRPGVVEDFLRAVSQVHRRLDMACTMFVRGRTLEEHTEAFQSLQQECGHLIDFQQYTYSGLPLKTVCQENHEGVQVFRGLSPEQCRESLARTLDLMETTLRVRPIGLAGPLGYYRGLSNRLAVLEVIEQVGIRFIRTYTRNAHDWYPVAFEVQPFDYTVQGVPTVLEIPGQGWPDAVLRETLGLAGVDRYVDHVKKDLDYVAAKGLTWSYMQHDWSSIAHDPDMAATAQILEYARELNFEVDTHQAYYEKRMGITGPVGEDVQAQSELANRPSHIEIRAPRRRKRRAWRSRRMWLRSRIVRDRKKPQLKRLMKKAGSVSKRRLMIALSREGA